ncbi:MAG: DUF58 domain-containing protein [Deltaproteobacteria bacterium]|nr:DUF58 domain-containing protein [Deltaproteobacteria bacterium]
MIPKELAKKIRYIEIYTSKAVNDVLAGRYQSVFKGRGMEFEEVREYAPGDEIRSIDWNVTARMGRPFVKRFVEERELSIMFLVDLSASGSFGSVDKTKNEVAAELCALLAFSAIKNNDKVGLIAFTDEVEMYIPPKKGTSHVLRLIRELLGFKPRAIKTDISAALDYLGRLRLKRAVVFLVSDFIAEGFERPLRVVAKRHDLIALSINDPREMELPAVGLIELKDTETGEQILIDSRDAGGRQRYAAAAKERRAALQAMFRSMSIDHVEVISGHDYVRNLMVFFRQRERRRAA